MRRTTTITAAAVVAILSLRAATSAQFREAMDVVELNVAVLSSRKPITGLVAADFEVTDNGVPQTITSVAFDGPPIDLTVIVDTSENLARSLAPPVTRAIGRIRDRLGRDDRLSIVCAGERVNELVPLSPASSVAPPAFTFGSGHASLYDALGVVLTAVPAPGRRQMVMLFTDGFDRSSLLSEAEVLDIAGRSVATVFVVSRALGEGQRDTMFMSAATSAHPDRSPGAFFERLTSSTGGLVKSASPGQWVRPVPSMAGTVVNANLLDDAFLDVLDSFRASYVVRYTMSGVERAGWHNVAVRITRAGGPFVVRARSGYRNGG